jgi:hypothetical protein
MVVIASLLLVSIVTIPRPELWMVRSFGEVVQISPFKGLHDGGFTSE